MDNVIDDTDQAIINALKSNARLPIADVAAAAHISTATAHRRLKKLIDSGVIRGFTTLVAQTSNEQGTQALVHISLHNNYRSTLRRFYDFLRDLPEVQRVYFLSGAHDFAAHVNCRDSAALSTFVSDTISRREEVASTNTSFIFTYSD
ncbi:Lrp/AsnC family transcriptional regulator [Corynebacterium hindlerae]|uniref:Lrp/AsnC family transcriptional regulator n=1 Tax=Corynebacterium hindlerae TaxID=699041 RepID=A0A7G5FE22_9CORY|nr:Lrp/AsnC family transcriptional regulator [Corynebacterium hindlerae]QMV84863.1 Lrp/AsnC family transcriptional regulator [Corynebacterium hindlerae]